MLDIANCPVYILSKLNIALHAQHIKRSWIDENLERWLEDGHTKLFRYQIGKC